MGDEKKEKIRFSAILDGLVDVVQFEGRPFYLFKTGEALPAQEEVAVGNVHYRPPPLSKTPFLLPRGEEVLRHYQEQLRQGVQVDAQLFDEFGAYLRSVSELPSEVYYDLLTAWVFHTYLIEQTRYSPVICLYAIPERGKSRTGQGLIYAAYRGVIVENLRESNLIRFSTHWRATLLFDVMDLWKKAERNESQDLILHRFERGAKVARVLHPEWGPHLDTVFFEPFGATVIATNMNPHHILETRAITINMPETSRKFENDVTPELALPLRERLLAFRARHMGRPLPSVAKPADGRLGDIARPLLQIIRLVRPEREEMFLELLKKLEAGRQIEKADSLDARILKAVIALRNRVEHGVLSNKVITDEINIEIPFLSSEDRFSCARIRNRLAAMGFEIVRGGNGAAAIVYNAEYIERMRQKFGLPEAEKPDAAVGDGADVSDTSDTCGKPDPSAGLPSDEQPF